MSTVDTHVPPTPGAPDLPGGMPVAGEAGEARRRPGLQLWLPLAVLVLLAAAVVAAPLLAPHDPDAQDLASGMVGPFSPGHLLGTDQLGRDVFSRTLYGGRPVIALAAAAALLAGLLGSVLGLLAGYLPGAIDQVLSRVTDVQLAIPSILLAMVTIGFGGHGLGLVLLVLVLAEWPLFYRLSRTTAATVRQQPYVRAARSYGAPTHEILVRHLARAVVPVLVIAFTLTVASAIALESSLSFLGLGLQPPAADWGAMVAQGNAQLAAAWWIAVVPGVAIALFVFTSNLVGDRLSELFSIGGDGRGADLA